MNNAPYIYAQYKQSYSFIKKHLLKPFILIAVVFLVSCVLTSVFFSINQDVAGKIIASFKNSIGKSIIDSSGHISALKLIANNMKAAVLGIVMGFIPLLFIPIFYTIINAAVVGALIGIVVREGSVLMAVKMLLFGILPHGILELTAIFLSFTIGVCICRFVTAKIFNKNPVITLSEIMNNAAGIFLFWILPALVAAGLIETYITPLLIHMVGFM